MHTTRLFSFLLLGLAFLRLALPSVALAQTPADQDSTSLDHHMSAYWEDNLRLNPITATFIGDNRYDDRLPVNIGQAHRAERKALFSHYLDALAALDTTRMSRDDRLNYDLLRYSLQMQLEGLSFHDELLPVNQFQGMTLLFPVLGSGQSAQPFKTVRDYENFLSRIHGFVAWADTAIANMRRGMANGYVLPKVLVERTLPQLQAHVITDPTESLFYRPVAGMPDSFSQEDSTRLARAYVTAIQDEIVPAYERLHAFMRDDYLPKARPTAGIGVLPDGRERYAYLVRYFTTTSLAPEEIFEIGMREVKRIRSEMDAVRQEVGFEGDLQAFFEHVRTSPGQYPFLADEEVLDAYRAIEARIAPNIDRLFSEVPEAGFEIRQTEKFRAASASEQYFPPSADGTRPGVFYVPIVEAAQYPATSMESTFLHEAIPGHHFQIAFQMEQQDLPAFRRFGGYGAYTEGWGLYAESLGKELGLYTDPYQYFGRLMWDMHRSLRLVVDVGLHAKGWTREEAIEFMLKNNGLDEEEITREVERYMANPGQALSYKIGELKLGALREHAQERLGEAFDIRAFHGEVLRQGALPLSILEQQIEAWIAQQR